MEKNVLAIFAHPDDAEIMCAGTLSLLRNSGWTVHIATMTPGDKGSAEHTSEEISRIRKAEAAESARMLEGIYHCLEFKDAYILYDRESINTTTSLIREVKPMIVFTSSPSDYMVDHEMTSMIVRTACFCAGIKNMDIDDKPFEPVPYLYYSDAMEGKDMLGNPVGPSIYVDISGEMEVKERMLACHASQRNWLLSHHKIDEYIISMKEFSGMRGHEINKEYAEGFRQHLGHGFPQINILLEELKDYIFMINEPNIK
jgi:LmbE family N-acetylglucosaminyl deacetylase